MGPTLPCSTLPGTNSSPPKKTRPGPKGKWVSQPAFFKLFVLKSVRISLEFFLQMNKAGPKIIKQWNKNHYHSHTIHGCYLYKFTSPVSLLPSLTKIHGFDTSNRKVHFRMVFRWQIVVVCLVHPGKIHILNPKVMEVDGSDDFPEFKARWFWKFHVYFRGCSRTGMSMVLSKWLVWVIT